MTHKTKQLTGAMPALVTSFKDGKIDDDAFCHLVERQLKAGSHGVVVCGTTGESATLTTDEYAHAVQMTLDVAGGQIPVIAGTGGNSTDATITRSVMAQGMGVDGLLIVTPYYNKPSQAGMHAHYSAVAKVVDIPILLYNVPGRTGVDLSVDTATDLMNAHSNIVGIKDATGDLSRVALTRAACGHDISQLSGDDPSTLGFMAHGGQGAISVTANVAPDLYAQMMNAAIKGDFTTACDLNDRLAPLHAALFSDASPGPAKYALAKLGLCQPDVRMPLVAISDAAKLAVDKALKAAGLL